MIDLMTTTGYPLPSGMVENYIHNLVNRFFKILPMRENGEDSLHVYMRSLSIELTGFVDLVPAFKSNPSLITLLSILEFLINTPECELDEVRREVFHAISVCNKLESYYSSATEV